MVDTQPYLQEFYKSAAPLHHLPGWMIASSSLSRDHCFRDKATSASCSVSSSSVGSERSATVRSVAFGCVNAAIDRARAAAQTACGEAAARR